MQLYEDLDFVDDYEGLKDAMLEYFNADHTDSQLNYVFGRVEELNLEDEFYNYVSSVMLEDGQKDKVEIGELYDFVTLDFDSIIENIQ